MRKYNEIKKVQAYPKGSEFERVYINEDGTYEDMFGINHWITYLNKEITYSFIEKTIDSRKVERIEL